MKRILVLMGTVVCVAFATWSSPQVLGDTSSYNPPGGGWTLAIDPSHNLHFVWINEYDAANPEVHYRNRNSSGTLSSIEDIGDAEFASVGIASIPDTQGVIWTDETSGGEEVVTFRARTSGTWESPVQFDTQVPGFSSSICSHANDFHIVFWKEVTSPEGSEIIYRKLSGNDWGDFENVALNDGREHYRIHPSITVNPAGVPHVVWVRTWDNSLGYSKRLSTGWTGEVVIANSVNSEIDISFPHIVSDSNGVLHVVYVTSHTPSQIYYIKSTDNGETWSTPLNLSSSSNNCGTPTITIDNAGNIWVFWVEFLASSRFIFYRIWKSQDSSWTEEAFEYREHPWDWSLYPSALGDDQGKVHLMWTEVDTASSNYQVYYSFYTAPDVEMDSILVPVGNIPDTAMIPEGIVRNNSDVEVEVTARCWITGEDMNYEEDNTEGVINVPPDSTVHVTFPEWTPGDVGDSYEVRMRVYLTMAGEIETNLDNNEKTDSCSVSYTHDMQAEERITPVSDTLTKGDSVKISASFSNQGLSDEINVPCAYYIYRGGSPITFGSASIDTSHSGETDTVEFTNTWVPSDTGMYELRILVNLSNDENPENDTLIDTLYVKEQGVSSRTVGRNIVWDPVKREIIFNGFKGSTVEVFNVVGVEVGRFTVNEDKERLRMAEFSQGIYFIKIKKGKKSEIMKIINF